MSFNSNSLDRLRQLNQKLKENNQLQKSSNGNSSKKTSKLHKVETEENPQKLFHSLMDVSPDGNIPTHLLSRLKETESQSLLNIKNNSMDRTTKYPNDVEPISSNPSSKDKNEEDNLYVSFKSLLLEEEI